MIVNSLAEDKEIENPPIIYASFSKFLFELQHYNFLMQPFSKLVKSLPMDLLC